MKKFLAIILAGLMLLSLTACGAKKDDNVKQVGLLEIESSGGHRVHEAVAHADRCESINFKYYSNLTSGIMDLKSGKVAALALGSASAAYVAEHNENLAVYDGRNYEEAYSMMTLDYNKEIFDILNDTIVAMKADGTLDALVENELKAYIESDPEAKDMPVFEGAKTIKVGVTGDLPPMDFVAANGKAAGFNVALLTEIANRNQVNIELVQVDTGSRAMALSSGAVDAIFWTRSVTCVDCDETFAEDIAGTLVTEGYFSDNSVVVKLKADK